MITYKQYKALSIIRDHPTCTARTFAIFMWQKEKPFLFTKVSNQGNGACSGKAAWLCAGGYVGKLEKAGLVRKYPPLQKECWVVLEEKGIEAMKEYELNNKIV